MLIKSHKLVKWWQSVSRYRTSVHNITDVQQFCLCYFVESGHVDMFNSLSLRYANVLTQPTHTPSYDDICIMQSLAHMVRIIPAQGYYTDVPDYCLKREKADIRSQTSVHQHGFPISFCALSSAGSQEELMTHLWTISCSHKILYFLTRVNK